MLSFFLSSPGIYLLVGFIVVGSLIVYWKRNWLRKELARWRLSEMTAGPAKFSRLHKDDKQEKIGVEIGEDAELIDSVLVDIVGGNRIEGNVESSSLEKTSGIKIGEGAKLKKSKMNKITGGNEVKRE